MIGSRSWNDSWIRTIAVAAFLLTILSLRPPSPAQASPALLPDLVPDAPENVQPAVTKLGDGQNHFLLRFDGFVHNIGEGALEIRGSRPVNGTMTVTGQRIYRQDSSFYDDNGRHPQIYFENSDGHRHWHLKNAARFSLWDESGTAELVAGAKVGFCLEDVDPIDSFAAPRDYSPTATEYCKQDQPGATQVVEGISRGWRDVYAAKLPFQWVDVSDAAPGSYRLGALVDPDNFVLESNEANNGPALASPSVTVPGYSASSGTVVVKQAQTIGLGAAQYGSPGPAQFKIESAPKHGRLSSPIGAPLAGPQVVYAPSSGFSGSDTFTYSARDSSSEFPRRAPVASVTVTVPPKVRLKLLSRLRFWRHGRFQMVRARASKSGSLKITIKKGKRRLGSCRKRVRSRHRFTCRIKLRRHASPGGAKAVVSLLESGKPAARSIFRVPRRLRRA